MTRKGGARAGSGRKQKWLKLELTAEAWYELHAIVDAYGALGLKTDATETAYGLLREALLAEFKRAEAVRHAQRARELEHGVGVMVRGLEGGA